MKYLFVWAYVFIFDEIQMLHVHDVQYTRDMSLVNVIKQIKTELDDDVSPDSEDLILVGVYPLGAEMDLGVKQCYWTFPEIKGVPR